jgi:hypothetical protein
MEHAGAHNVRSVENRRREIVAAHEPRCLAENASAALFPKDLSLFMTPLIDRVRRERDRARLVAGIRLPRDRRNDARKIRKGRVIEPVTNTVVGRRCRHECEEIGIVERQVELEPMQIHVFEMQYEVATLIVLHAKAVEISTRLIICARLVKGFA